MFFCFIYFFNNNDNDLEAGTKFDLYSSIV